VFESSFSFFSSRSAAIFDRASDSNMLNLALEDDNTFGKIHPTNLK